MSSSIRPEHVTEVYARRELVIRVTGDHCREFMTIVTEAIDRLNESYRFLKARKMIPCNCHSCKTSESEPQFYTHASLIERIRRAKSTVECEHSYEAVDVRSLLEGVFTSVVGKRYEDMKEVTRVL